jgi:hypothetical protein
MIDPNWRCFNCGCLAHTTPHLRKGPTGEKTLCNVCGLYFLKHNTLKSSSNSTAAPVIPTEDPFGMRPLALDEMPHWLSGGIRKINGVYPDDRIDAIVLAPHGTPQSSIGARMYRIICRECGDEKEPRGKLYAIGPVRFGERLCDCRDRQLATLKITVERRVIAGTLPVESDTNKPMR